MKFSAEIIFRLSGELTKQLVVESKMMREDEEKERKLKKKSKFFNTAICARNKST